MTDGTHAMQPPTRRRLKGWRVVSDQDTGLIHISDIALTDAIQRSDMWREFSREFLRLGALSQAMRGPQTIMSLALQAAKECSKTMSAEMEHAENSLRVITFLSEADVGGRE
jgi:hypothetical protein